MREYILDKNKQLSVYDDVFDLRVRQNIFLVALNSKFSIGWSDGVILDNSINRFLHAAWTDRELSECGILEAIGETPVAKEIGSLKLSRAILNLATPNDSYFYHAHSEKKILLYYVNLEWLDGWHGETLFFDESGRDILFTSRFTPNRIIAFDGSIPHALRPPSILATKFRFSLALIYDHF